MKFDDDFMTAEMSEETEETIDNMQNTEESEETPKDSLEVDPADNEADPEQVDEESEENPVDQPEEEKLYTKSQVSEMIRKRLARVKNSAVDNADQGSSEDDERQQELDSKLKDIEKREQIVKNRQALQNGDVITLEDIPEGFLQYVDFSLPDNEFKKAVDQVDSLLHEFRRDILDDIMLKMGYVDTAGNYTAKLQRDHGARAEEFKQWKKHGSGNANSAAKADSVLRNVFGLD